MPSNNGAFFTAVGAPLEVRPGDYPTAGDNEVIVKAHAVAINPVDTAMQRFGPAIFKWLKPPAVFGEDVAGEVEAVGPGVTKFKVGDRVTALSTTAFQERTAVKEHMVLPIPASLPYEQAAVLPLGLSVAIQGLFGGDYLNLQRPSHNPRPNGETLLVWGASTSVGSNAVQLAAAAGYEVVATASTRNFELAKRLGASQVFDYASPTVSEDLVAAFRGKRCAGAFCNGGPAPPTHPPVVAACAAVVSAAQGGRRFLALTMAGVQPSSLPEGVDGKFVEPLEADAELATAVFGVFTGEALKRGSYVAAPQPKVVGHGLQNIQGAMEELKKGVSAVKLVVTL